MAGVGGPWQCMACMVGLEFIYEIALNSPLWIADHYCSIFVGHIKARLATALVPSLLSEISGR